MLLCFVNFNRTVELSNDDSVKELTGGLRARKRAFQVEIKKSNKIGN